MEVASSRPEADSKERGWLMGERRGKTSGEDRAGGAADKVKGRMKEAAGAVTGNEELKAEGKADQRKGTMKEKKGKLKNLFE